MRWIEFKKRNFKTIPYTKEEKERIKKYLLGGEVTAIAPGFGEDINGNHISIRIEKHSDGVFEWRNDMAYYVEQYNMALPEEFLAKILKETD